MQMRFSFGIKGFLNIQHIGYTFHMNKTINIYQIFYNEETRTQLDAGFIPLDNSHGRSDWYEFWPIRQFLLTQQLDESAYYGFLAPSFSTKTDLTSKEVFAFIAKNLTVTTDAFVFSPFWAHAAFFRNVFEQGEIAHPGLMSAAEKLILRCKLDIDLSKLMTHSQNTAYCNYVIAKPSFWRQWLVLANALFEIAENEDDEFGLELSQAAYYGEYTPAPMKVFLQERLTTLVLATQPLTIKPFDTSRCSTGLNLSSNIEQTRPYFIACDALKQAYVKTGYSDFETAYLAKRIELGQAFDWRKGVLSA